MNSWTDIVLILAIVIGLISAASLPMVSVNAVSSDSLRLRPPVQESPWALVSEGRIDPWTKAPSTTAGVQTLLAIEPAAAPTH